MSANGIVATPLAIEMTRPQPRSFIPGTSRVISRTIEPTFWLYSSVHCSAVDSSQGTCGNAPALLTRMSAPPKASFATVGDGGVDFGIGAQVTQGDRRLAAGRLDLGCDPLRLGLATAVHHDRRPLRRQRLGDRLADPAAAPRHDRTLADELKIHDLISLLNDPVATV